MKNDYGKEISRVLLPSRKPKYAALDIYSGAGGLSLGLEATGFDVTGIDRDPDCCDTYDSNLRGECTNATITPEYDFPDADIVVGGPPCQPFSVRGKQLGRNDGRNGIPSFMAAVRKIRPKACVFENVRGMLYRNKEYFDSFIEEIRAEGYEVADDTVNCADYGVPQSRERVIVVGHRGEYSKPEKLDERITAGEALKRVPADECETARYLTAEMDRYIEAYEKASKCNPRDLNMKKPARTLTCRNLSGHTSDMHRIRLPDGRRRMLYTKEAARLQGFPDWFVFKGSMSSALTQIGNAVPPLLALAVGRQVMAYLDK